MIVLVLVGNAWLAGWLIHGLIDGSQHVTPGVLLTDGVAIWSVNVFAFALFYWQIERDRPRLDFLFPQKEHEQHPDITSLHWKPTLIDYLYLSYTNATAFSPTDVVPLSHWAKVAMMIQSAISLGILALIIARAVNTLH
jgi:hypothetical protein